MNDDIERCPGTNRNGERCGHPTGWGTDSDDGPCKHHGGAADNRGANNGNFKHGAFSEHFQSDLTDREQEAYGDLVDALGDEAAGAEVVRGAAAEALLKYKRSGDPRFLREARQLLSKFNIVDATEHQEVEHTGDVDGSFDVSITHHRVTEEEADESRE